MKRRPLISDLVVAKDFRRRGVARSFLSECEKKVKEEWEAGLQQVNASVLCLHRTTRLLVQGFVRDFSDAAGHEGRGRVQVGLLCVEPTNFLSFGWNLSRISASGANYFWGMAPSKMAFWHTMILGTAH